MLKRTLLVFLVFTVMIAAAAAWRPAFAQSAITLSGMEVDLWPEYDQPAVLVIYRITLPATLPLPADLTFRIPAAAGEPSAVAVKQADASGGSGLFSIDYTRTVNGQWGEINLKATAAELQIEYYDPGLVKQDAARQYTYNWPGDYATDKFSIQVQQPVDASDMKISPASGGGVTGQDGLVYYNKDVGALPAGQGFSVSINYTKNTDTLSATSLQVQPGAPVSETPSASLDWRSVLPWALGVLGVGLILGGGWWYYQTGRGKPAPAPARRRHRATAEREDDQAEGHVYCHQCGKRAAPGDRFCRMCGAVLRQD